MRLASISQMWSWLSFYLRSGFFKALQSALRLCEDGLLAVGTPCGSFIFLNSSTSGRTALRPMGNEGLRGWVGSAPAQVVKRTLAGHLGHLVGDSGQAIRTSGDSGSWSRRCRAPDVGLVRGLSACWTHCWLVGRIVSAALLAQAATSCSWRSLFAGLVGGLSACWIAVHAEAATSQHPALADQASPCLSCCDT